MKKKIKYTDEPEGINLSTAKRVKDDFLPKPGKLEFKKEQVVTLRLDEPTLFELKKIAAKKGLGVSSLVRMWVRERLAC